MKIEDFKTALQEQVKSVSVTAPERSGIFDTANDNLTMVTAYLHDGETFLASGDPVNALAAFRYGLGWLHCGAACGLYSLQRHSCPPLEPVERVPDSAVQKLEEKVSRYQRLLAAACFSVTTAAEPGTIPHRTAERVHAVASVYAGQGGRFLLQGRMEDALACFSYGHGWLDAGTRAGLFSVGANRDIFTI
jgi:hypothetical protein